MFATWAFRSELLEVNSSSSKSKSSGESGYRRRARTWPRNLTRRPFLFRSSSDFRRLVIRRGLAGTIVEWAAIKRYINLADTFGTQKSIGSVSLAAQLHFPFHSRNQRAPTRRGKLDDEK
ncbi:hypothetical protein MAR_033015 [Mya arenaria]|uniref:Uncharacterized protein n=1 Tax=Mya arenaria TaxID=6604 RepID=A0ABY7GB55_MYAAR|nr:hypothetical protein MAR_033015 [Mya arenaria]